MSTTNPFSTYQPVDPIDYGSLTQGLIDKVNALETGREKNEFEVQKRKEELDLLATNANNLIEKQEAYNAQTLNDFILTGANEAKTQIYSWNTNLKAGKLSAKKYTQYINTLTENWTTLANSAKTYDKTNNEFIERQTKINAQTDLPEGSDYEQYLSQIHAEIGEIGNKKIFIDPNTGKTYAARIGDDGTIEDGSMTPTLRYAQPNNFYDNRINIDKRINSEVKNFGNYTKESGSKTVQDALQNPYIAKSVIYLKKSILNNARYAAQVLDAYSGDYDYYRTETEKKSKIEENLELDVETRRIQGLPQLTGDALKEREKYFESLLISSVPDGNGVYQPVLTKDQMKTAEEIVLDKIKAQMSYSLQLDEPVVRPVSNRTNNNTTTKQDKVDPVPGMVERAWNSKDVNAFKDLIPGYTMYTDKKKPGQYGFRPTNNDRATIQYFSSPSQLSGLVGYTSVGAKAIWLEYFNKK